ncbi:hypothetical protein [Ileibacterium valens]|uniref:Uncharacterized protein n=1 Tax=Ileibacterium valens TaxID=1862668 RepID=A0A1U7NDL0_9FIRM|nr:hypothetical protein [Ileibacterium valens]OLU37259.1 hypothetical protein BO224_11125 [Erysipelotrichaceae bacterium NYU-BL-E8]OLU37336.1 hypothetical protein BO222_10840 [Ileibacterium valens]OLU37603.1 hypothetical protein BM735_10335 [Erysipelotrichaceae bacterium NYU-BL-F16]
MDTKKLTRLIDVLTEAGLSIREAQALIEEGCRKIPDMEKKMKEELCKPSILRKTVVSPREKDQEGYLILGYDPDTQLAFLEKLRDRDSYSFHCCTPIEIDRFISGEFIFKEESPGVMEVSV